MLTREQILGVKPKRMVVEVPELGGAVTLQEINIGAAHAISEDKSTDRLSSLVIASVINEDGSMMFSPEDYEAISRLTFSAGKRLLDAINAFNGYSDVKPVVEAAASAVEAATKNSGPGLNGGSSSD